MSNPYQASVQQKLAHGRLMLDLLQRNGLERQAREALLQGAVLHLAIAYRQFLRELASYFQYSNPEQIHDLGQLESVSLAAGVVSELRALGWLSDLIAADSQLLAPLPPAKGVEKALIASDLRRENGNNTLSPSQVQAWCNSLTGLIDRQRAAFEES